MKLYICEVFSNMFFMSSEGTMGLGLRATQEGITQLLLVFSRDLLTIRKTIEYHQTDPFDN